MFLAQKAPGDIEVLITNMKVDKAVRPNSIPANILKDCKSEFPKPLRDMTNASFITGIFPTFLSSKCYSHYKKGKVKFMRK